MRKILIRQRCYALFVDLIFFYSISWEIAMVFDLTKKIIITLIIQFFIGDYIRIKVSLVLLLYNKVVYEDMLKSSLSFSILIKSVI